jgi:hypothetical protein
MRKEEWDWPPPRMRMQGGYTDLVPAKTGWSSPLVTKICDVFFSSIVLLIKLGLACALTLLVVVCFWLLTTMLSIK